MFGRVFHWLKRQLLTLVFGALLVFSAVLIAAGASTPPSPASSAVIAQAQAHPSGAPITPAEDAVARERGGRARLLGLGVMGYQAALLLGFLAFGGVRWLAGLVGRIGRHWLLGLAVVIGILFAGSALLSLPLDYYTSFIFPHQYGLSNQTTASWLRDYLVGQGVSLGVTLPVLGLFYALLRRSPRRWWLWTAAASVPIILFLVLIEPVFIAPLFNTFTPVKDESVRQGILDLAHAQGIAASDVFEVDASRQSRAVNAYVNGFGPTQRIVLYDTLLQDFTPEEINTIMAHEMGHYKLGHITQGIVFAVLGVLAGGFLISLLGGAVLRRWGGRLGIDALGHPAGLPLLLALGMALSLVVTPISSALSRRVEWEADVFGARVYPHHRAAIAAFYKMARLDISEMDPPKWAHVIFGTHPTLRERVEYLERLPEP